MVSVVVIVATYGLIKSNKTVSFLVIKIKVLLLLTLQECTRKQCSLLECNKVYNRNPLQCWYNYKVTLLQMSNSIQCDGIEPLNAQPCFSLYVIPQPLCNHQSFSTLYYGIPQPLHNQQSFSTNDLSYLEVMCHPSVSVQYHC